MKKVKIMMLSTLYLVAVVQAVKVSRMDSANDRLHTSLVDNDRNFPNGASVAVERDRPATINNENKISRKVLIGCGAVTAAVAVATSVALFSGNSPDTCSDPEGDVIITANSPVRECPVIRGNLIVSNDLQGEFKLDNYFPNLERVEGNINLIATSLTSFDFKHDEVINKRNDQIGIEVGGDVIMFLNPSLEHVDLSDVTSIENSFVVERNVALADLSLATGDKTLVVEKNVEVKNNPTLESLELANTEFIGGLLEVESNQNMQVINTSELQAVGFIVLSGSSSLQTVCTSTVGCFPAVELPEQAQQGGINVLDSVQLCETTENISGERVCVTTDPVTNEPVNCPIFDYQNEPTDRSCADYVNQDATAGCESYNLETLTCSQELSPEPETPSPTPFMPLCRQNQVDVCDFYHLWFIENGENRQCNTYNSERGSCTCQASNIFYRFNVGETVCVQGQCDLFCDQTRAGQHQLCDLGEHLFCTWIGFNPCNYDAICKENFCAPRCTYPELKWLDTPAPTPSPPTHQPSASPTTEPTRDPSAVPTLTPTPTPTSEPSSEPSAGPTFIPTYVPTSSPVVPLTDNNINTAIDMWIIDRSAATETYGHIEGWDTRQITDLAEAFSEKQEFNDDISKWDVSRVATLYYTFRRAESFNADISKWDVSRVTTLEDTFLWGYAFNTDISQWDVSKVTTLFRTFQYARSFDVDIAQWDVSSVTTLDWTFYDAEIFNADISNWDVSSVNTAFSSSFTGATSFNADISRWDVSRATRLRGTFTRAQMFNADISQWDVCRITFLNSAFDQASSFNADISSWDVSRVTLLEATFRYTFAFDVDISSWDVSNVESLRSAFQGANSFNIDISQWDVSKVDTLSMSFRGANSFNTDISQWDVSRVTTLTWAFENAHSFNAGISQWDVSKVDSLQHTFENATSFNADISRWDTSSVRFSYLQKSYSHIYRNNF